MSLGCSRDDDRQGFRWLVVGRGPSTAAGPTHWRVSPERYVSRYIIFGISVPVIGLGETF